MNTNQEYPGISGKTSTTGDAQLKEEKPAMVQPAKKAAPHAKKKSKK